MTRAPRSGRTQGSGGITVAVTRAASPLGRSVCRQLAGAAGVRQVVALDAARPRVGGVRWRRVGPTDAGLSAALRRVDVLMHLAAVVDPDLDRAAQRRQTTTSASVALMAAAANNVGHIVVVSSARLYGARADNPVPLADDAPLRAEPDAGVLGDLLEVENYLRDAVRAFPHLRVAVLRPAAVVGPGLDDTVAGPLDGPRLLVVRGSCPRWQFCHLDDLASAVEAVIAAGLAGPVTVASDGWLEQAELERALGRRRLELPADVAFGAAARLHALGVTAESAGQLAYLMHPPVVASGRLRALGWRPRHTNAEALASYAAGRPILPARPRVTAKGATAAAGATVALVGTAALVRRARRRRQAR